MKRSVKYALIVLAVYASLLLLDFIAPYLQSFDGLESCGYVVIDVYGILKNTTIANDKCYKAGMTLNELRALGKLKAERIIIVTHFFSSNGVNGLGTSDPVELWTPFQHLSLFPFLVKGTPPDGGEYVSASTTVLLKFSLGYNGKEIILITCHLDGIEAFTKAFPGAKLVAVTKGQVSVSEAEDYVGKVIKADDILLLCGEGVLVCG